jgi:hypothetical protein
VNTVDSLRSDLLNLINVETLTWPTVYDHYLP